MKRPPRKHQPKTVRRGRRVEFVRQFGVRRRSKSARPFIVATWRVRYLDLAVAP